MKKLLIVMFCVVAVAGYAQATEWNFYGSAIVQTFWADEDLNGAGTDPDTQFAEGLSGESVIGAEVKVSDTVSGFFEYGAADGVADVRYLYGVWNFGAGSLEIGKDDGTLALPGSDQAYDEDAGLGGWGEMSSEKKGQIRLIFGGFQIAFREPDSTYNDGTDNTDDNIENIMPSIEAKYTFAADNYNVMINGGYHTFDVGTNDEDVTSYVIGLGGDASFGAVTLAASIYFGQNVANLVDCDVNGDEDANNGYAEYDGTNVIDNDALAWRVVLTYAFNDMVSAQAGYGFMKTELDDDASTEDEVQSYYLQVPITLAPGVTIVPEAGVIDYKEDGQTETTYFGAKWQIEF